MICEVQARRIIEWTAEQNYRLFVYHSFLSERFWGRKNNLAVIRNNVCIDHKVLKYLNFTTIFFIKAYMPVVV